MIRDNLTDALTFKTPPGAHAAGSRLFLWSLGFFVGWKGIMLCV